MSSKTVENETGSAAAKPTDLSSKDTVDNEPNSAPAKPPGPPDGGYEAWSTVAGCFLAFFASFGFVTGFGVFQAYYESVLPGRSSSDISWIGSFQLWCITGLAIPSVLLNAHIGPHATLAIGTFFTVFGVMMASISTQYYQFLLSQGICTGIGVGLTFLPIIGLPNQWFSKRRGLAVGLAIGGSSIGGVIWPILINQMLNYDGVGYPWTMRTIGFIQLATMGAAIALIKNNIPRNRAVKIGTFPFVAALKNVGMDLMVVALLLHFFGIYIPYIYVSLYTQVLGASAYTAFWTTAALNAATFFGRFVMGAISDKLGATNTLILCVFISSMLAFAWQGVTSVAGVFVWVVIYGWFSGASISLQSPAAVPLVPKGQIQLIGPYVAILCQLSSFGSLGGGPAAGALLGQKGGYVSADFHPTMWLTGSMLLGAVLFYTLTRYTHTRRLLAKA